MTDWIDLYILIQPGISPFQEGVGGCPNVEQSENADVTTILFSNHSTRRIR